MAGTFGLVMLVFSAVNTWVNPLWVTPAPWSDAGFAEYRQIYRSLRTAKAGLIRSRDWDVAFIGSSRVAISLDPANPHWGDLAVVNLGISAGTLPESAAILDYLLRRRDVQRVIVGIDLTDITTAFWMGPKAGFYESPFSDRGDSFERELRYIAGISSFEASVKTMGYRSRDELPPYTTRGHWARYRSRGTVREVVERDSVPHAIRFVRMRKAGLEVNEWKARSLRRIVRGCLDHGVALDLIIPPNHAAYLSVFFLENDPEPAFATDRRAITGIVDEEVARTPGGPPVRVWDFNDFHPLNCESLTVPDAPENPRYWADGTHAHTRLGDIMLARLMDWPLDDPLAAGYGEPIDASTVDARLAKIRAGYRDYRGEHPDDWNWVRRTIAQFASTDNGMTPGSVAPDPHPIQ